MELRDVDGVPLEEDRRRYWNERYAAEVDPFGIEPNQFVAAELGDHDPATVLDLGSGQGRNAVWLASRGHDVTAVDISSVAMDRALELADSAHVTITPVVADLTEWTPSHRYDIVLLSYIQVEPATRRLIHTAAAGALAPGGTLLVIAHHSANIEHGVGGPQVPELLFDEGDLREDFAALEITNCQQVLREVEGSDPPAIDVLLVATKGA